MSLRRRSRTSELLEAEKALYCSGLSWWLQYKERHALCKSTTPKGFEHDTVGGIHMVRCIAVDNPKAMPLVCLHGYAHGTSIFYAALAPLAERWGGPVYALDSPGCGLSSRPPFEYDADAEQRRERAERFFCEGLERWRFAMGIDRMVLVGHSIGGLCAFSFAEAHPERVERLVLLSPAGVPRPPEDLAARYKDWPAIYRFAIALWARGFGPLGLVKAGEGWGPGRWLINRYAQRRMSGRTWSNTAQYAQYMYLNHVAGDGSWGAAAHATLLLPGANAAHGCSRAPICDRIASLDWVRGPTSVVFVFGKRDWMDGGAAQAIRDSHPELKGKIQVCHVSGAGHNLPTDNPLGVVEAIVASGCVKRSDAKRQRGAGHRTVDGAVFGKTAANAERAWRTELQGCGCTEV